MGENRGCTDFVGPSFSGNGVQKWGFEAGPKLRVLASVVFVKKPVNLGRADAQDGADWANGIALSVQGFDPVFQLLPRRRLPFLRRCRVTCGCCCANSESLGERGFPEARKLIFNKTNFASRF